MNMEELLTAASKNPWVFGTLGLFAFISAWQPLARLLRAVANILKGIYEVGVVRTGQRYRDSVDAKAREILKQPGNRDTLLISYTTFSVIAGMQSIMAFLFGISILMCVQYVPNELGDGLLVAAFLFLLIGLTNALIWMIDAAFQLLVHSRLRMILKSDAS